MITEFENKYAFLSNFYPSPFTHEGITYPTNEHFFQAMKTGDRQMRKFIANADAPGEAKRLGRNVALREDWEKIKKNVMKMGLELKFSDPNFKELLLATGNEELVEGNWWHDNLWGSCYCDRCKSKFGHNLLGELLMGLREELKREVTNGTD